MIKYYIMMTVWVEQKTAQLSWDGIYATMLAASATCAMYNSHAMEGVKFVLLDVDLTEDEFKELCDHHFSVYKCPPPRWGLDTSL